MILILWRQHDLGAFGCGASVVRVDVRDDDVGALRDERGPVRLEFQILCGG